MQVKVTSERACLVCAITGVLLRNALLPAQNENYSQTLCAMLKFNAKKG
jgi:hypothetical protein